MSPMTTTESRPSDTPEKALARFLLRHAEALVSASALLGGEPAVRRTARLLEDLIDAPRLTRRLRHDVVELHRLLALERVDEPDSIEASCFARIDPEAPVVEELCVLTDALRSYLLALAEAEHGDPLWEQIIAAA